MPKDTGHLLLMRYIPPYPFSLLRSLPWTLVETKAYSPNNFWRQWSKKQEKDYLFISLYVSEKVEKAFYTIVFHSQVSFDLF